MLLLAAYGLMVNAMTTPERDRFVASLGASRSLATGPRGELLAAVETVRTRSDVKGDDAVVLQVDQVGHWTMANLSGELFTAANDAEFKTGLKQLVPKSVDLPTRTASFFLAPTAVFSHPQHVAKLPSRHPRALVSNQRIHPLETLVPELPEQMYVRAAANVYLPLTNRDVFRDLAWQMEQRPGSAARARLLSLNANATMPLPAALAAGDAVRLVSEQVNPYDFAAALSALRGQTVIVSGKRDGKYLAFNAADHDEQSVLVSDLKRAARTADVNLILVNAQTSSQPGPRTLTFSDSSISGVDVTTARGTFAELISAMAGSASGPMILTAGPASSSHRVLTAQPLTTAQPKSTLTSTWETVRSWWRTTVTSMTGDVDAQGITMVLRQPTYQIEMDRRIVTWLPSWVAFTYLGLAAVGLLLFVSTQRWWRRFVPAPRPPLGNAPLKFAFYRLVLMLERLAFILVGAPLLAVPATVGLFLPGRTPPPSPDVIS